MIPEFEEFLLPTLQALSDGKTLSLQELRDAVIAHFDFSDEELAKKTRSGNKNKIVDQINWATTYLFQSSLIERPYRASVRITFSGMELLENPPRIITREFLMSNYPSFKVFQSRKKNKVEPVLEKSNLKGSKMEQLKGSDGKSSLSEMKKSLVELNKGISAFKKIGCSATKEQLKQIANLEAKIKELEMSNDAKKALPDIVNLINQRLPENDYAFMVKRVKGVLYYVYSTSKEIIGLVPSNATKWNSNNYVETSRKRRPNLNFFQMGLITGDELVYNDDTNITVTVVSENRVSYNGKDYSLTKLTQELKGLKHAMQPTGEWSFEGQNLLDLYNETYPFVDE